MSSLDIHALPEGTRIGPCRLVRRLGGGGSSAVYQAELAEDHAWGARGSAVALKLLDPQLASREGQLDWFRSEASLCERIRHAGVARAHQLGEDDSFGEALHFMIQELVDGENLREMLTRLGPLPEPLVRYLGYQAAVALSAIHAEGIVHGDIKPANLVITPEHVLKIIDLGVARTVHGRSGTGRRFFGTPDYAAPEQFTGERVGPAADLRAIGLTLYELATGTQPFRGDSFEELRDKHLNLRAPLANELRPELSPFLTALLGELLERQPDDRLESAEVLAQTFQRGEHSGWWARTCAARPGVAQAPSRGSSPTLRLVGREAELAQLVRQADALREGEGSVLLLVGEPGIGKTRLVQELLSRESLPGAVIRVDDAGAGTRRVVGRALREATRGRSEAVADDGDESSIGGILARLRSLTDETATILVVEDLSPTSRADLGLIQLLVAEASERALFLLLTARDDERAAAQLGAVERVTRLDLGPLGERDAARLGREASGTEEGLGLGIEAMVRRSGGNPLFLLELLRATRATSPNASAPDSIRALAGSRVSALDPDARSLLELAAAWGPRFEPALLARAAGRPLLEVLALLADIESRTGLIEVEGGVHRFSRQVVHEVLRDQLEPEARRRAHLAWADALRDAHSLEPSDVSAIDDEVLVTWTEQLVRGRSEEAWPLLETTFTKLMQGSLYARVEALARVARSNAEDQPEGEPDRLVLARLFLAISLDAQGRAAEAKEDVQWVRSASERLGLGHRLADAMGLTTRLERFTCSPAELRELAGRTAELARAHGPARVLNEASLILAEADMNEGLHAEARAKLERCLAESREADFAPGEIVALLHLSELSQKENDLESAADALARAARRAEEAGRASHRAWCLLALGPVLARLGRTEEARRSLILGRDQARETGTLEHELDALDSLAVLLTDCGEVGAGRRIAREGLRLAEIAGSIPRQASFHGTLGRSHAGFHEAEEAERSLRRAIELAEECGWKDGAARFRYSLAQALTPHAPEEAVKVARLSLDTLTELGVGHVLPGCRLILGRALARAGRVEDAKELLARVVDETGDAPMADQQALARAILATLSEVDPATVTVGPGLAAANAIEAHLLLHEAGGGAEHVNEAKRLLLGATADLDDLARARLFRAMRERFPPGVLETGIGSTMAESDLPDGEPS